MAAGALARGLLAEFGVRCVGFVVEIAGVRAAIADDATPEVPQREPCRE